MCSYHDVHTRKLSLVRSNFTGFRSSTRPTSDEKSAGNLVKYIVILSDAVEVLLMLIRFYTDAQDVVGLKH